MILVRPDRMPILTGTQLSWDARGRSVIPRTHHRPRAAGQLARRSATLHHPLRRGLRPGARRARLAWALKPHNKQERDEPVKMNNERMLVRDANTGEMMEMCLKTGHLLKLGSPPMPEDMRPPASALRHKKPVPAHLRPKEVAPIAAATAPPPAGRRDAAAPAGARRRAHAAAAAFQ